MRERAEQQQLLAGLETAVSRPGRGGSGVTPARHSLGSLGSCQASHTSHHISHQTSHHGMRGRLAARLLLGDSQKACKTPKCLNKCLKVVSYIFLLSFHLFTSPLYPIYFLMHMVFEAPHGKKRNRTRQAIWKKNISQNKYYTSYIYVN